MVLFLLSCIEARAAHRCDGMEVKIREMQDLVKPLWNCCCSPCIAHSFGDFWKRGLLTPVLIFMAVTRQPRCLETRVGAHLPSAVLAPVERNTGTSGSLFSCRCHCFTAQVHIGPYQCWAYQAPAPLCSARYLPSVHGGACSDRALAQSRKIEPYRNIFFNPELELVSVVQYFVSLCCTKWAIFPAVSHI